jgi:hypothetical protein
MFTLIGLVATGALIGGGVCVVAEGVRLVGVVIEKVEEVVQEKKK